MGRTLSYYLPSRTICTRSHLKSVCGCAYLPIQIMLCTSLTKFTSLGEYISFGITLVSIYFQVLINFHLLKLVPVRCQSTIVVHPNLLLTQVTYNIICVLLLKKKYVFHFNFIIFIVVSNMYFYSSK